MTSERSATPEAAKTSIDRMTFFSDAVVAIAMTLLAIDLPVPDSNSSGQLGHFVADRTPEFLAFLVSFLVIAQYWRAHHTLFRYVRDTTPGLLAWNALWLLTIVLTPYATRVLYGGEDFDDGDMPWRFAFYAAIQAVAAASFFGSQRVVEREGLADEATPFGLMGRMYARDIVLATIFLVSIPLAFWVHEWAFVVWGLIPFAMRAGLALEQRRLERSLVA